MSYLEVFAGKTEGQFYYRVVATNGQCLAISESYPSLSNAKRGARDCINAVMDCEFDVRCEVREGSEGEDGG